MDCKRGRPVAIGSWGSYTAPGLTTSSRGGTRGIGRWAGRVIGCGRCGRGRRVMG